MSLSVEFENVSYSHCPQCGQQAIGGQFACGHRLPASESFVVPTDSAAELPAARQQIAVLTAPKSADMLGSPEQMRPMIEELREKYEALKHFCEKWRCAFDSDEDSMDLWFELREEIDGLLNPPQPESK